LKILAFVFLIPGFILVFAAKYVVRKFNLYEKIKVTFENEMSEEEIVAYKLEKAILNFKIISFSIIVPGLILLVIAFRAISN